MERERWLELSQAISEVDARWPRWPRCRRHTHPTARIARVYCWAVARRRARPLDQLGLRGGELAAGLSPPVAAQSIDAQPPHARQGLRPFSARGGKTTGRQSDCDDLAQADRRQAAAGRGPLRPTPAIATLLGARGLARSTAGTNCTPCGPTGPCRCSGRSRRCTCPRHASRGA